MTAPAAMFGVVAKTARGREQIAGGLRRLLPATFPRRVQDWWIEPEAGVALYAPIVAAGSGERSGRAAQSAAAAASGASGSRRGGDALAIAGSVVRDGERWRWPEAKPRDHGAAKPGAHGAAKPGDPGAAKRGRILLAELALDPAAAVAGWRGDCALAFWDGARGRLSIARDPLGQRGVFVREDADVHWICSELAPLMADPAYACQLDFAAAFHYLVTARTPWGRTLADGIVRVPPAHLAVWQPGRPWLRQRCYTPLRETAKKVADPALRGELRAALDHAVSSRLTGERQALLLSGGVDSSYLAARGAALAGGSQLDAYTIEFAAPVRNEVPFARLVAEQFGLRHHVVPLGLAETAPLIERVLAADEPCAAWSTVTHHHLLERVAGDGHTELWSGLGSDEVFGGYKEFLQTYLKWRPFQTGWPAPDHADAFEAVLWNRRDAAAYLFSGNARFLDDASIKRGFEPPFDRWRDTSLLEEFYREGRRLKAGAHWFELAVAHECEHRIPDLLFVNFEPIARAHGIHTSYPFLDLDVVPIACGLGATERFQHLGKRWLNKKLLRELAATELPAAIMDRPLASYSAPVAVWLTTPAIARPLMARMRKSKLWQLGLLRRDWLNRLEADLERELATGKAGPECQRVWALITLAAWYDRWVEGSR